MAWTKKINKKRATVANYPKTREQLVSKRAEYGIDTQGKATKAGIEKFARRRKQSNLPLTKKDISAAKKSMVGTGRKGADVGKYGGKLSKQRYELDTEKLEIGHILKTLNNEELIVEKIRRYNGEFKTYTILTKNNNFFVDGILVHSEINH